MRQSSLRLTAWIALAAMLFGAMSPALAAALFPDRADILGRMLAIPAVSSVAPHDDPQAAAAAEDDGCPHESAGTAWHEEPDHSAHHGGTAHPSQDGSEHAVHGTFCLFCLPGGAMVTLLTAAMPVAGAQPAILPSPVRQERQSAGPHLSGNRSRGPPASLLS